MYLDSPDNTHCIWSIHQLRILLDERAEKRELLYIADSAPLVRITSDRVYWTSVLFCAAVCTESVDMVGRRELDDASHVVQAQRRTRILGARRVSATEA